MTKTKKLTKSQRKAREQREIAKNFARVQAVVRDLRDSRHLLPVVNFNTAR
jgi:hypothetical protein